MECCSSSHHRGIPEGSSGVLFATLRDEEGELVGASDLEDLTLTLRNKGDDQVINERDEQDVLNDHNVEVFDSLQTGTFLVDGVATVITYNVRWNYIPLDTPFFGADTIREEDHVAHLRAVWDDGNKAVSHQFVMTICNIKGFAVEAST